MAWQIVIPEPNGRDFIVDCTKNYLGKICSFLKPNVFLSIPGRHWSKWERRTFFFARDQFACVREKFVECKSWFESFKFPTFHSKEFYFKFYSKVHLIISTFLFFSKHSQKYEGHNFDCNFNIFVVVIIITHMVWIITYFSSMNWPMNWTNESMSDTI